MLKSVDKLYQHILKMEVDEREDEAQDFRRVLSKYDRRFQIVLKNMFAKQEKEVLAKLGVGKGKDYVDFYMFDISLWQKIFEATITPYLVDISGENGQRVWDYLPIEKNMKDILVGGSFDVEYPEAISQLESQAIKFSIDTNAVTERKVREQIIRGFQEGLAMTEVADKITAVFDYANRVRSELIAQTEMARAANIGAVSAYKQSGVVEGKEWLTAQDEMVCPWCSSMDRRVESLNTAFLALGATQFVELADGTVISNTNTYLAVDAAPLHPRCRCTVLPVIKSFIATPAPAPKPIPKPIPKPMPEMPTTPSLADLKLLIREYNKTAEAKIIKAKMLKFEKLYKKAGDDFDKAMANFRSVLLVDDRSITDPLKKIVQAAGDKRQKIGIELANINNRDRGNKALIIKKRITPPKGGKIVSTNDGDITSLSQPGKYGIKKVSKMPADVKKEFKYMWAEVEDMLHPDVIKAMPSINVEYVVGQRAYNWTAQKSIMDSQGMMTYTRRPTILMGNTSGDTLMHEYGHHVEKYLSNAKASAGKFLADRTKGEKLKTIYKGTQEKGWEDKFFNHYCGKKYDGGSTEILSMGLEKMFMNPYEFYESDKGYFELIMKTMWGDL